MTGVPMRVLVDSSAPCSVGLLVDKVIAGGARASVLGGACSFWCGVGAGAVGLATARLLRAAERAGVERFVFFSALGASMFQRTRFFRAKALAEEAVAASPLATAIFAPSIVYDPGDRWVRLLKRLALLPVIPISGSGRSAYQPIWAADVARCVLSALERDERRARYELAGPEVLTYDEIALTVARAAGRERPLVHVPLGLVHLGLVSLRRAFGEAVFRRFQIAFAADIDTFSSAKATSAHS